MDDAHAARRVAWVAASLDLRRRPALLAEYVRSHAMEPPPPNGAPSLPGSPEIDSRAREMLRDCEAAGVAISTPDEEGWVSRFWGEMSDPPAVLYTRGSLHGVGDPAVAIVGSRHPSDAGREIAFRIARDLAAWGVTIVSGLALGIDAAAHRGALDAGGHTVAVLGSGVDRVGPPSNRALGERIARTGALASEFPLGREAQKLHFPRRNRILAGFAEAVLIVEGHAKSGARSTVEHALALGREVAAVPRDPIHSGAELPDALIRSGAAAVTSARDLLDLLRGGDRLALTLPRPDSRRDRKDGCAPAEAAGALEQGILSRLGRGARSFESLRGEGICPPDALLSVLGRLESMGLIRRMPGMRFSRAGGMP